MAAGLRKKGRSAADGGMLSQLKIDHACWKGWLSNEDKHRTTGASKGTLRKPKILKRHKNGWMKSNF